MLLYPHVVSVAYDSQTGELCWKFHPPDSSPPICGPKMSQICANSTTMISAGGSTVYYSAEGITCIEWPPVTHIDMENLLFVDHLPNGKPSVFHIFLYPGSPGYSPPVPRQCPHGKSPHPHQSRRWDQLARDVQGGVGRAAVSIPGRTVEPWDSWFAVSIVMVVPKIDGLFHGKSQSKIRMMTGGTPILGDPAAMY